MKKRIVCMVLALCLIGTLFAGCSQQKIIRGEVGSEIWKEAPPLTYGVLEAEPLALLPWNCGRMEFTSQYHTAETELGYYFSNFGVMFFADKVNLSNWVPVCSKPDCSHPTSWSYGEERCDAYDFSYEFVIKNNRIYFSDRATSYYPQISKDDVGISVLVSTSFDGSDRRLEYSISGFPPSNDGNGMSILTGNQWLYLFEAMDKNGKFLPFLSIVSEEGTKTIPVESHDSDLLYDMVLEVYGDEAFTFPYLATYDYSVFRYIDGQLVETDLSGLDTTGAYLSGNTLRVFRPGDGYYDVNLTTREEVFLAPAQLENSGAKIALPNCIIETTLLSSEKPGEEGHRTSIFDGQTWREVTLPEELVHTDKNIAQNHPSYTICSDCILLFLHDRSDGYIPSLYRIPLTDGELKAEFCSKIFIPEPEK